MHSRPCGHLFSRAFLPAVLLTATALSLAAQGISDIQQEQLKIHTVILNRLRAYTPDQQFKMVYGVVAKANERDRDRNRRQAETLMAKANEISAKNPTVARNHARLARAYAAIAELNHKVVQEITNGDQEAANRTIGELVTAYQQAAAMEGKPSQRDWYTPYESETLALTEMQRQKQQQQQQKKTTGQ